MQPTKVLITDPCLFLQHQFILLSSCLLCSSDTGLLSTPKGQTFPPALYMLLLLLGIPTLLISEWLVVFHSSLILFFLPNYIP